MANNITNMLGAANYSYLFNNNKTKAQNSINQLWSNYNSFSSNATSNLGALTEIRQNAAAVVESYNTAKDTFYKEFDSNMSALKESAANLRNFDFRSVTAPAVTATATNESTAAVTNETSATGESTAAVTNETSTTSENTTAVTNETSATGESTAAVTNETSATGESTAAVTNETSSSATSNTSTENTTSTAKTAAFEEPITRTQEVGKDGKTTTKITYSKAMQDALDTIKDFISNYNDTIKFLKDNGEVSGRVSRMAENFGDTTYRSSLYESVGISVGKDGTLSINEEKLAQSIVDNPDKVSSVLGSNGLAGKAEQHVNTANGQRTNLFPSAKAMLGNQLDAVSLYTGRSYINMTNISNIGNLLNMMF